MFVLVRFKVVAIRKSPAVSLGLYLANCRWICHAWETKQTHELGVEGRMRVRIVRLHGYRLSQRTKGCYHILLSPVWIGRGNGIPGNPCLIYYSNITWCIRERDVLYLQLNSHTVNIYPVLKDLSAPFCSLKPHLRQVLYVEGMVYIIFILLSSFIARDLAAKQLPELADWRELGLCQRADQLLSAEEAACAFCPARPLGRAVRRPACLWVFVCMCILCSCPCTSFAGAICLNWVLPLATGKVKGKIPACLKRHKHMNRGCCSVIGTSGCLEERGI